MELTIFFSSLLILFISIFSFYMHARFMARGKIHSTRMIVNS